MVYFSLSLDTNPVYARAAVSQYIKFHYYWSKNRLIKIQNAHGWLCLNKQTPIFWYQLIATSGYFLISDTVSWLILMQVHGHVGCWRYGFWNFSLRVMLLQGDAPWWRCRFSVMWVLETRPKAGFPSSIYKAASYIYAGLSGLGADTTLSLIFFFNHYGSFLLRSWHQSGLY